MIYFASDFHLSPDIAGSNVEESNAVAWLDDIAQDASKLFLLGDIFDFWFEYKHVVPKGHLRLLGKLATLSDAGLEIHFFPGNHDQWCFGYLEEELGMHVHHEPGIFELSGKTFFLGHGDGLGPGDYGYKRIKKLFGNAVARSIFRWIHPDIGVALARKWSEKSRNSHSNELPYSGKEKEWLFQFANTFPGRDKIDYFIFGHRHIPMELILDNGTGKYINLGEWMYARSYARFDGEKLELLFYKNPEARLIKA